MTTNETRPSRGVAGWLAALVLATAAYVVSSGPVLAVAFWLREQTGWDGFYAVMWLYYPLLIRRTEPVDAYITWWVELFDTVGPG